MKAEINKDPQKFEEINWDAEFRKPTLIWYSPLILPRLGEENKNYVQEFHSNKENNVPKEEIPKVSLSSGLRKGMREKRMRTYFKHEKKKIFYSGQCEVPFRIRICGIDNIFRIFEQVILNRFSCSLIILG